MYVYYWKIFNILLNLINNVKMLYLEMISFKFKMKFKIISSLYFSEEYLNIQLNFSVKMY